MTPESAVVKKNSALVFLITSFILLIACIFFAWKYYSLKTTPKNINTKSMQYRLEQQQFYPYDPQSPMVTNLVLSYSMSGIISSFKQTQASQYVLVLGSTSDNVNMQITVDSQNLPRITDSKNNALSIDSIIPQHFATVNLLYDKLKGTQKVVSIRVNQ